MSPTPPHETGPQETRPVVLAVVGVGPTASSFLERLMASVPELLDDTPLVVHLIDPHRAGTGRIWRSDQSHLLWMNSMAEDVTMFTDDSVRCAGPRRSGPSLIEWARGHEGALDTPELTTGLRTMTGMTFPPRLVQSAYLDWFHHRVVDEAPANVTFVTHACRAIDVIDLDDGRQRVLLDAEADMVADVVADVVIFALGHLDNRLGGEDAQLAAFAADHGLFHLGPAHTAEVDLSGVPAGERVIVRGFGLAFVDLLVMLTLGRGGRFVPRDSGDGGLDYVPSGREPVLVIGSRRGVPYRSKLDYRLQGTPAELPRFLATPIADALIASKDRLDFFTDVWPLAAKDVAWGYYTELFSAHSDRTTLPWDEFADRYATVTWGTPEYDRLVADAVPDGADRFDVARLDHPLAGLRFATHGDLQEHLRAHIEGDAARRRNPAFSADLGAFRAFLLTVGQVARFSASGKMWVGSKVNDIDGWWFGFFMYFASGPPPARLDQLVALSRAGVVEFVGADMWVRTDDASGRFLTGGTSDDHVTEAVGLIEARNARPSVSLSDDLMIQAMFARGEVREESVVDERDGSVFNTGRLSVSQPDMRIVDAGGALHPRRHALGANTSRPAAGAFARPRTNAPAFRQNDHVARVVLIELAAVAAQNSATNPGHEGVNS